MRALVPAETLVYLETNDLAAALQPIVDSKPFTDVAKSKPDFSALKGIQLAVAVTGFQTSEEKLTDETSVGRIQPRFVAVAETHAWNYQAVAFAENKLSQFVTDLYGTDVTQERVDNNNGVNLSFASTDGRKSYALVSGSLIYFTNDETIIDKCLAVKRGESDSIAKTGKVQSASLGTLASGYVTTDGIGQIANLVSIKIAAASDEDGDVRSYIAYTLPELIRSSANDVSWVSSRATPGIEDRFAVSAPQHQLKKGNEHLSGVIDSFFEDIEETTAEEVAAVIAGRKPETATATNTIHRREDHFTSTTAERRLVSDLGFLGWMIARLVQD